MVITPAEAGSAAQLFDLEIGGGPGVRTYNGGIGGTTMQHLKTLDKFSTLSQAKAFQPHLSFICSEINAIPGRSVAEFKADTLAVINGLKYWNTTIVLLTANPVQGLDGDPSYKNYTKALYEVADETGVRLIDHQARWNWADFSNGGLMSDAAHPNAAGYQEYARMIWNALEL